MSDPVARAQYLAARMEDGSNQVRDSEKKARAMVNALHVIAINGEFPTSDEVMSVESLVLDLIHDVRALRRTLNELRHASADRELEVRRDAA